MSCGIGPKEERSVYLSCGSGSWRSKRTGDHWEPLFEHLTQKYGPVVDYFLGPPKGTAGSSLAREPARWALVEFQRHEDARKCIGQSIRVSDVRCVPRWSDNVIKYGQGMMPPDQKDTLREQLGPQLLRKEQVVKLIGKLPEKVGPDVPNCPGWTVYELPGRSRLECPECNETKVTTVMAMSTLGDYSCNRCQITRRKKWQEGGGPADDNRLTGRKRRR
eukprot:TRINITY_DN66768_c0_g1_i1.p2 TRINITY_DN66768_c0_g1~~TRINITY_DN66768_c0_g1_i1.p2  ORF type:complete len:246 (+),score=86.85 TRINITY_DN66768_c0_g1_i1:82-738(+)